MRKPNGVYIPRDALRHRGLYELAARKLHVGIWDATHAAFLGLYDYLEWEYLWTESDGTASAVRLIEMLPEQIDLREHDPSTCSEHDRPVYFRKRDDGTPFGDHFHADDDSPLSENDIALTRTYMPIYEYLESVTHYEDS